MAGGAGKLIQQRFDVADAREDIALPRPASPAPRLPADADLSSEVDGLTRLFTPNREFYRVDTAISVPQVRPADFRLTFDGMFDSPRSYTLGELFDRDDLIERDVTLTCVSNEVGGVLAGNARWLGVPLGAILRENGIQAESTQLVCRSTDGMTIGTPTRSALEVEDAMLAFGMNGEPLPVEHGFPLRMVIPGLYGYVSACKWLTRIQATTFEAFDAYWVERGWAAQGPIKVASRIDTPGSLRNFPAGRRAIAGVAWAQGRGIERVEVQIDEEDWVEAQLSPADEADMWRQWVLPVRLPTRVPPDQGPRHRHGRRGADRRPRRPVPERRQRLAHPPGGHQLNPAPATAGAHPHALPSTRRPDRSSTDVTSSLLRRGAVLGAVSALTLALGACGSDDPADSSAADTTEQLVERDGVERGAGVRRAVRGRLLGGARRRRGQLRRHDRRPGGDRGEQQPGAVHARPGRDRRQPRATASTASRTSPSSPRPTPRSRPSPPTRCRPCWPTTPS